LVDDKQYGSQLLAYYFTSTWW